MSRVLLAWEMGSNLGHLSRLLPVSRALEARGHEVLVAVRDVTLAATTLTPAGISFVQAPVLAATGAAGEQPASYADLLRMQGWADAALLGACLRAWIRLLAQYRPQTVVIDHSPTALLAARCCAIPSAMLATGFELPPALQPLPPFPGFSGATMAGAAVAESRVLDTVNQVLTGLGVTPLIALRQLFEVERRWLTTFPELDHYGSRPNECYVGPIGDLGDGAAIDWPAGEAKRVFAYLRPNTPGLAAIVQALGRSGAAVICWAPGIEAELLRPLNHRGIWLSQRPVELQLLRARCDLCVSYSPAATVTSMLLSSVPHLLAPAHVEAQMTAHRVECLGAGLVLRGHQTTQSVEMKLRYLLQRTDFHARAHAFAVRYRGFDAAAAVENIAEQIDAGISRNTPVSVAARRY